MSNQYQGDGGGGSTKKTTTVSSSTAKALKTQTEAARSAVNAKAESNTQTAYENTLLGQSSSNKVATAKAASTKGTKVQTQTDYEDSLLAQSQASKVANAGKSGTIGGSSSSGSSYTPPVKQQTAPSGSYTPKTNTTIGGQSTVQQAPPVQEQPQFVMSQEQQQAQSDAVSSVDSIMGGYQQLQAEARSMGNEALVALAAQWDKMSQMLDGLEAQITNQIKGQMNGDDPAMQNAIKLIRDEADKMRKETLDELNARGLVQSGVYAKALSDMNNNELTQVQSAVASRFGDLQTQLNNAIMSLAQTRISALSANQNAVISSMTNTQNNVLSTGLAGLNSAVSMRGQDIQNSQFNQQLAQNQSQFNSSMQYNYAGLQQNQSQFDSTMQYNRDQMKLNNEQFYAQLSQADKQFYAQLSSSEKMGFAQIASSQGAQAANSAIASERLKWEQQMYNQERADATQATAQSNTYTQVGNATAPGGFVDSAISRIVSGAATVDGISGILKSGGYTPEAQAAIMNMIKSDPNVQKKISSGTTPQYTPSYPAYAPNDYYSSRGVVR